jgi:hypothetical protein
VFSMMPIPPDVEIQRQLTAIHINEWLRDDVFKFRWWLLLVLLAVFFASWWRIADKKRLPEIVLYVALATIVIMAKNEYGEELVLWDYPTDIIPIFPPLTSLNLISLPLIYSLVYQHFRTSKSFIGATFLITAVLCFGLEPLMAWGRLYELVNWRYYLNYPLYVAMAIGIRAAVLKICTITAKSVNPKSS